MNQILDNSDVPTHYCTVGSALKRIFAFRNELPFKETFLQSIFGTHGEFLSVDSFGNISWFKDNVVLRQTWILNPSYCVTTVDCYPVRLENKFFGIFFRTHAYLVDLTTGFRSSICILVASSSS